MFFCFLFLSCRSPPPSSSSTTSLGRTVAVASASAWSAAGTAAYDTATGDQNRRRHRYHPQTHIHSARHTYTHTYIHTHIQHEPGRMNQTPVPHLRLRLCLQLLPDGRGAGLPLLLDEGQREDVLVAHAQDVLLVAGHRSDQSANALHVLAHHTHISHHITHTHTLPSPSPYIFRQGTSSNLGDTKTQDSLDTVYCM